MGGGLEGNWEVPQPVHFVTAARYTTCYTMGLPGLNRPAPKNFSGYKYL